MIWPCHATVGFSLAQGMDLNLPMCILGSLFPDFVEIMSRGALGQLEHAVYALFSPSLLCPSATGGQLKRNGRAGLGRRSRPQADPVLRPAAQPDPGRSPGHGHIGFCFLRYYSFSYKSRPLGDRGFVQLRTDRQVRVRTAPRQDLITSGSISGKGGG